MSTPLTGRVDPHLRNIQALLVEHPSAELRLTMPAYSTVEVAATWHDYRLTGHGHTIQEALEHLEMSVEVLWRKAGVRWVP